MILHKFWAAFVAQLNKIANVFWEADPVAQMRYEYDQAVAQLKDGRGGLEQYRGLVERVTRQVNDNRSHAAQLEAQTKAHLKAGDRVTAAKFALELQKPSRSGGQPTAARDARDGLRQQLEEDPACEREAHRAARQDPECDAELKMSAAEAEIAKLAEGFDVNVTTDFGEIESVSQRQIDQNRGKVRVAADLSSKGIADIQAEERMQGQLAEEALSNFEVELGLKSPETTKVAPAVKDLGPAEQKQTT